MRNMRNTLLLMIPLFLMCACSSDKNGKVPGIDLEDLDTSVSPKDDFYAYANGGWIRKNPLKSWRPYERVPLQRENAINGRNGSRI